jgi:uncharacterized membrane protein
MAGTSVDDLLKQRLVQYLDHLEAGIRQGGDFVASQAPDVAREIVAFNLAQGIALVVFGIVLIGTGAAIMRWLIRNYQRIEETTDDGGVVVIEVFGNVIAGAIMIFGSAMILHNFSTVLQCYFAPKYFVIQQIIGMLK